MKTLVRALAALGCALATAGDALAQTMDNSPHVDFVATGPVRVNCLANLDAVLNIIANGFEVGGILIGAVMLTRTITRERGHKLRKKLMVAILPVIFGLSSPAAFNLIVATMRDNNLF